MKIRLLPSNLVNQIAAGEVVERPASVVKELVENAVDAGATRIDVVLTDGGRSLIVVTDNGCGMSGQELTVAVDRHATSKLPSDDLLSIDYLGFRGEALPAIGSVARLTVTSRTADADSGWYVMVAGGRKDGPVPAPHPIGTRIEVRDIFYATPARLKFLKAPQTELNYSVDAVERLAMAHSNVAFSLTSDGKTRLNLPVSQSKDDLFDIHLERLGVILGKTFAENALPVAAERENIALYGYIGVPTFNRGNALAQYLFVNGRPVRDRLLSGAVRAAYRDFLAPNRHPYVVLFLDVPQQDVDVNVHPSKAEVRFSDSGMVRGLLVGALKHALTEAGHKTSTTISDAAVGALRPEGSDSPALPYHRGNHSAHIEAQELQSTLSSGAKGLLDGYQESILGFDPSAPTVSNDEDDESDAQSHPLGAARAQVHETYIVAQTMDGIVIVDQHAAHERLVYERMKLALGEKGITRQMLLIPEVVELDEASASRLAGRANEFAELGLVIELFGAGTVVVREIPALLGEADIQSLIRDLADDLESWDEAISLKDRLGDVCGTLACHGSVRAGRRLSGPEMNAVLRQMEVTPNAGQCNHGRPTYVELKLKDIERIFGRR
ncbi:MAG: DNA mismatch repair endonuclease MutL [Candidatus Marinimicrobia bacterium]|nr:DNA mismatch repair endonuclease MutL [Candidatus Neomarinimicrobiota bacterium]